MYFENTGLEDKVADLVILTELMRKQGLVTGTGWDYERVTYDRKFVVPEGTYYLRLFTVAKEGDVGANDAIMRILKPVLGKYYYPHGVEYGDDEFWPPNVVSQCKTILENLRESLLAFELQS